MVDGCFYIFFKAEEGIRDLIVTGVQTCALPIFMYVYVAMLRNLQFDDFVKKPSARSFRDYSSAQFVFDLARFGRRDWSCGDETLRGETPNMATVLAGKAMTLPNLDEVDKLGSQFAQVRIEKGAAGGTERNPGQAR